MYTHQLVYPFTTWGTSRLFPNSGRKDNKYKHKKFVFNSVTHLRLTIWTPWTAAHQASLSITNSWSLLKLMSIKSVMPSNHLILCHPLLLLPGLPVHCQLLEFTQTHVHKVSDAIQPSHPLSSPSPPAFNLSQRQSLFKWVSSLHQVAKVLEFQWIFRTDLPRGGLVGSPFSSRDSQ